MRARHFSLLGVIITLFAFFLYCVIDQANHTLAGVIFAVLSLALLIGAGRLLLFPRLAPVPQTGAYAVASFDCFYTDPARIDPYADDGNFRQLSVTFWYPADDTRKAGCPLIVFSHGSFGVKSSNETLYRELASYGYVVCAMDHTYQCFTTWNADGRKIGLSSSFMREIMRVNPDRKPEEALGYFQKWMSVRMGDIHFVLDTVLEKVKEQSGDPVYLLPDPKRIALIGHSLGGSAVLGAGRVRTDVSAVISLEAPFMYDIKEVINGQFLFDETPYPVPILNIYSDSGWKLVKQRGQYAENDDLLRSERADVHNTYLSGANHLGLTDFAMTSPFLSDLLSGNYAKNAPQKTLEQINTVCLAFLDHYLKARQSSP